MGLLTSEGIFSDYKFFGIKFRINKFNIMFNEWQRRSTTIKARDEWHALKILRELYTKREYDNGVGVGEIEEIYACKTPIDEE